MGIRSTYFRVNCLNLFVACTKLNIVNVQISVAFADLGKGDSRLAPTDLQEIEYNCQTDDSSSALWLDMDSQSGTGTCTTDGDSSRLVNEPETSDDSQTVNYLYNCPVCDQIADNDTIVCGECGEWFHFNCAGVDQPQVDVIPDEVPFICMFCNDRAISSDNDSRR